MGIPVVSLITLLLAYDKLTKEKIAPWDRKYGLLVVHDKVSPARWGMVLFVAILLGLESLQLPMAAIAFSLVVVVLLCLVFGPAMGEYEERVWERRKLEVEKRIREKMEAPVPEAATFQVTRKEKIEASAPKSEALAFQEQIWELKRKHPDLFLDDVEEEMRKWNFARTRELLDQKEKMLERREKVLSELGEIRDKLASLSARLADGEIDAESYKRAADMLETRKVELREELAEIDSKLYRERYEKPV